MKTFLASSAPSSPPRSRPPRPSAPTLGRRRPRCRRLARRRRLARSGGWHVAAAAGTWRSLPRRPLELRRLLARRVLGRRRPRLWDRRGRLLRRLLRGYYYAPTSRTTTTPRSVAAPVYSAVDAVARPPGATGAAGVERARADLLSEERPERRDHRVRSPRMQSLGDDPARRDERRQHLPARDVRLHGRSRLHRPVAGAGRRGPRTRRALPATP